MMNKLEKQIQSTNVSRAVQVLSAKELRAVAGGGGAQSGAGGLGAVSQSAGRSSGAVSGARGGVRLG